MRRFLALSFSICYFIFVSQGALFGQFSTQNVTLLSNLSLSDLGAGSGIEGSDIWGWTDPLTGRDYALFGRTDGTAFVDVTNGAMPDYLGYLPSHTGTSSWRDIKVYSDHAFIVSDSNGPHGMQVFDLTNLRGVTTAQTFSETAHHDSFRNAHNIAINEDTGFAYVVGGNRASGGLRMINIQNPTQPFVAGDFSSDGYTHDVQVVSYDGPDETYAGSEIAFASNEDTLTIVDVTNKSNPNQLSRSGYQNSGYVHQGWLSEDQRYFFLNDEFDELISGGPTRTHVFDVSNLNDPQYVGFHAGTTGAIDHNLYVHGDYIFQANYRAGVRILEINDAATADFTEVGVLDTYPNSNNPSFNGAWSVYPWFEGGKFIVSDIERGLFVATFDPLATKPGDFNGDGLMSCLDIDALTSAILGGAAETSFDLNDDGLVDADDRVEWLALAGAELLSSEQPLLPADANLDGEVDESDFNIWNQNRFTQTSDWCRADFNTDGVVDLSDLHIFNEYKFQSSAILVPEPSAFRLVLMVLPAVTLLPSVRRRSGR